MKENKNSEIWLINNFIYFGAKRMLIFFYLQLRTGKSVLHSVDYMDDGSPINLTVTINENEVSICLFIRCIRLSSGLTPKCFKRRRNRYFFHAL